MTQQRSTVGGIGLPLRLIAGPSNTKRKTFFCCAQNSLNQALNVGYIRGLGSVKNEM